MKRLRLPVLLACATVLTLLTACRAVPADRPQKAYLVPDDGTPAARYAPVFALERYDPPYNRIGTPTATRDSGGRERIAVDPSHATIYVQTQPFQTADGAYTNLIYRIHFERVPGWHLTAGPNVGVFVVVTLDGAGKPVLVTTVHTCGCYLGFLPAGDLPPVVYPAGWPAARQSVYGEDLPAHLDFPRAPGPDSRLVIFLRAEVHRVMDADIETLPAIRERFDVQPAALQPMEALKALPLDGSSSPAGLSDVASAFAKASADKSAKADAAEQRRAGPTTSFYETEGCLKGYVKGSRKPFEMFLMGWWAFDFYVGRDKELGDVDVTGVRLYTSLKFWDRRASDLYPFPEFLKFWGWRL